MGAYHPHGRQRPGPGNSKAPNAADFGFGAIRRIECPVTHSSFPIAELVDAAAQGEVRAADANFERRCLSAAV